MRLTETERRQRVVEKRARIMHQIENAIHSIHMNEALAVHVELGGGYEAVIRKQAVTVKERRFVGEENEYAPEEERQDVRS